MNDPTAHYPALQRECPPDGLWHWVAMVGFRRRTVAVFVDGELVRSRPGYHLLLVWQRLRRRGIGATLTAWVFRIH